MIIGKGLILLLHGAPGVGKTSTAGKLFDARQRGVETNLLTLIYEKRA